MQFLPLKSRGLPPLRGTVAVPNGAVKRIYLGIFMGSWLDLGTCGRVANSSNR